MADALVSPAVGGAMWAASAGTIAYCSSKVRKEMDDRKVPLMGVLGAFIFAAQMINFTIPATGSSGHLGGGMILAILLGPHAAFLVTASVLTVQALFFADGGLLALGCNIFNLGFFPAFIAYPFIYKKIVGNQPSQAKLMIGAMLASIVGLQLGAFGVVLETVFSGISSLPFATFVTIMQPIHLGIGIVEGLVTASVISFVYKARPEIVVHSPVVGATGTAPLRNIVMAFFAVAVLTGGIVSWFASENPDGLEWSIKKVTGREELAADKVGVHGALAAQQKKFVFLPDYNFTKPEAEKEEPPHAAVTTSQAAKPESREEKTAGSKLGTSVAGLTGGLLTLGLAFIIGMILKKSVGIPSDQ